ncbi:hypothetical protein ACFQX6_49470 [Streptosporangium lutulentum]
MDVIVSNAVLQWVPEHRELLGRWVDALVPGAGSPSRFRVTSRLPATC